jgi:hypothetical protein
MARMKVAPPSAVPALESASKGVKFGDIFFETVSSRPAADLCTGSVSEDEHRSWKTPVSAAPFLKVRDHFKMVFFKDDL